MKEGDIFQAEVRYWSDRGYEVEVRLTPFHQWNHGFPPFDVDTKILQQAAANPGQNGFYVRIYDDVWNHHMTEKFQDESAAMIWLAGLCAARGIALSVA